MAELSSQPTSIQSLYSWHNENRLYVDRRYQRKLVWTLIEKQKLIESILKRYPIPAILIAERDGFPGTYEIIDGLQRVQAIVSFIETSFPTLDGRHFDLTLFPTANARASEGGFSISLAEGLLTQREISTILDYSLAISVMRNASEEEVNDVFDRINTFGRRLSDQERRQSGVQNPFSSMVREIACEMRGDSTETVLLLGSMPEISIDLPKTKHGYKIQADEVFWVRHGVLRATDLRDSMDEQCIADIAACLIGGMIIERSKDALDSIYNVSSNESARIDSALGIYGEENFRDEFKFCVDQILNVCREGSEEKLRDIVFKKRTTNAFPSLFATLLIATHELIVKEKQMISSYSGVKEAIRNLDKRIDTGRGAAQPAERRKNVDIVKGLVRGSCVDRSESVQIYGSHGTVDIDGIIRRSEIELSSYELKQGILSLTDKNRAIDTHAVEKVVNTICAIANCGPGRAGKVLIGVADKTADVNRIKALDRINPMKIANRFVVGVKREAAALEWTVEQYFTYWKDRIENSGLSEPLRAAVLSNLDFNDFFGLGILIITIPPQKDLSYVNDVVYCRIGDSTKEVKSPKAIADMVSRFL